MRISTNCATVCWVVILGLHQLDLAHAFLQDFQTGSSAQITIRGDPCVSSLHRHEGRPVKATVVLESGRRETIETMMEASAVLLSMSSLASNSPPLVADAEAQAITSSAPPAPSTETVIIKGQVTLAPDVVMEEKPTPSSAALYITCRPDRPDNVPAAVLNGSRGKPPPVLSARLTNPSFPLEFELKIPQDLTLEGAWDGKSSPETIRPPSRREQLWWNEVDLVVSARWDSDGVAATRSPEDLVGRGLWNYKEESPVIVQLNGRGAFGKFATNVKK